MTWTMPAGSSASKSMRPPKSVATSLPMSKRSPKSFGSASSHLCRSASRLMRDGRASERPFSVMRQSMVSTGMYYIRPSLEKCNGFVLRVAAHGSRRRCARDPLETTINGDAVPTIYFFGQARSCASPNSTAPTNRASLAPLDRVSRGSGHVRETWSGSRTIGCEWPS